MIVFPWLILIGVIVLLAIGLILAAGWGYTAWRHAPSPLTLSAATVALVATPILLAVLAWGLFLKPR